MSASNLPPRLPESSLSHADQIAMEIDVQTALALSRAATRAMKSLSPFARHAVEDAVEAEIALQSLREGAAAQIVVALLREELADAA